MDTLQTQTLMELHVLTDFGFYVLLAYAGAICNILWKLAEGEKLNRGFSFKVWVSKNTYSTLFHFVAVIIALLSLKEMEQLNATVAIMTGWGADVLIKNLGDKFLQKHT